MMINRNLSVHLQDFPDVSFFEENKDLVAKMDMVRAICSAALAIRDNKNLRVRLPLNELKIIGKNISEMLDFQDVIADEVNVKNVTISDKIDEFASQKLQINFKKIGAKYGAKVKEINEAARVGNFKKIDDNAIEIAGVKLVDDEFEIKFLTNDQDEKKFAIMTLPSNDCLVLLDIEITQDLIDEGISRDIVRLIQQSRKAADLNVSDHIEILIFSPNQAILEVAKKFSQYISSQVLASNLKAASNVEEIKSQAKFFFEDKIDETEFYLGISFS